MPWIYVIIAFMTSSLLTLASAQPTSTNNDQVIVEGTSVGTTDASGQKQTTVIDVNGNLKIIDSPNASVNPPPNVTVQNTPGMSQSAPIPTGTGTKANAPAAAAAAAAGPEQTSSTLPPPGASVVPGAPNAPGNTPTPATTPPPGPAAAPATSVPPGVPPPPGSIVAPGSSPPIKPTTTNVPAT